MEKHRELFRKELDRATEIFNREEQIEVVYSFLGALLAALRVSEDGKLTTNDIVDAYKCGIQYILNDRELIQNKEQANSVTCDDCEGTGRN